MSELMQEPWQVESLRLTVFSNQLIDAAHIKEWWKTVAPEGAIQDISHRVQEGVTYVTGSQDNFRLDLQIQANRLDWFMHKGTPLLSEGGDAFLGDLSQILPSFITMVRAWTKSTDLSVIRLALGGVIRRLVENEDDIYAQISEKLPFINFQPGWREFQFQINTPEIHTANENKIKINIIRRYCVEQVRGISLDSTMGTKGNILAQKYFSRIDLDINTDAEREEPLQLETIDKLLDTLQERV